MSTSKLDRMYAGWASAASRVSTPRPVCPKLCPKWEQQGSTDRPQHSRAQTITSSTTSPSTVLSEPVLGFSGLFSAKEVSDELWIGLLKDTAIMIAFLSIGEI